MIKFMPIFNSKADILIEKLRNVADGKTSITLLDEFNSITLDLIAHVSFNKTLLPLKTFFLLYT